MIVIIALQSNLNLMLFLTPSSVVHFPRLQQVVALPCALFVFYAVILVLEVKRIPKKILSSLKILDARQVVILVMSISTRVTLSNPP